jgi:hypothetical protein
VLFAAVLVALAFLAAGCGSSPAAPGVATIGATSTTGTGTGNGAAPSGGGLAQTSSGSGGGAALSIAGGNTADMTKFAACMRSNGVPNFPDPNAQGGISITPSSGIDPSSPQFQSAQSACQKLMPRGQAPSPAQQARMQAQALKFSACMRSHGEPNFPDPSFSNGGVSLRIDVGSGIDPSSPQFQNAQKACQKSLPGLATHAGSVGAVKIGGG